jgi:hypothetical protein
MTPGRAVPDSLSAAVHRHAAAHPAVPWLFERRGWDWTWISWQDAAHRIAGPPELPELPEPDRPGPETLLRHLRQQAQSHFPDPDLPAAIDLAERLGQPVLRDILVTKGLLTDPAERRLLAWATLTGAALLFEPDPAAYVQAAAWARPTVFQGTAAEVAALRREAVSFRPPLPRWLRRRRPVLPFDRLRALLPLEPLPPEESAFWSGQGVRIVDPGPSRSAASAPRPVV